MCGIIILVRILPISEIVPLLLVNKRVRGGGGGVQSFYFTPKVSHDRDQCPLQLRETFLSPQSPKSGWLSCATICVSLHDVLSFLLDSEKAEAGGSDKNEPLEK